MPLDGVEREPAEGEEDREEGVEGEEEAEDGEEEVWEQPGGCEGVGGVEAGGWEAEGFGERRQLHAVVKGGGVNGGGSNGGRQERRKG